MKNKVVVVTGGSSGIGKALALTYGIRGASIVFTGRNQNRMDEVSSELQEKSIDHLALTLDSASEEDNKSMIDQTIRKYGRLDVLICNAGISMRALFEDVEIDVFKQVMDINFYGTLYATKYALPHILETKGSIIGISSIN
ncbi:MAG: SDR family NAD(P)-dependent oxidoreductase [Bacteroidota bacterium]